MAKFNTSIKHLEVSKANKQMLIITSVAAFITVFCLVAISHLWGIKGYQTKVMAADNRADSQLKVDVSAESSLINQYEKFVNEQPTVLGTQVVNNSQLKYNNATIILDALPSQYDFPALTTTISKLLQSDNLNVTSIGGQDQSSTITNTPESDPQPVSMPFTFTIDNANYQSVQNLFQELQKSIRPMQVDTLSMTGTDTDMTVTVTAHTYYQPQKQFLIGTETIK